MDRYLAKHDSSTQECLEGLIDCGRVGFGPQLHSIRGEMRLLSHGPETEPYPRQVVVVGGAKGEVLFSGFTWGYLGAGPRGLSRLLHFFGVDQKAAELFATEGLPAERERRGSRLRSFADVDRIWEFSPQSMTVTVFAEDGTPRQRILPRRTKPMTTQVTSHRGHALGIAVDQILHRQLVGLKTRSAFAKMMDCDRSYVSSLISGKKQISSALGDQWVGALSAVPGMLTGDLQLVRDRCDEAVQSYRDARDQRRRSLKGPTVSELQDEVRELRAKVSFLESTHQRESKAFPVGYTPTATAMVASALQFQMGASAYDSTEQQVTIRENFYSRRRELWCIEITHGVIRPPTFLYFKSRILAATRFVKLVGPWAAMNAIRESMLEVPPRRRLRRRSRDWVFHDDSDFLARIAIAVDGPLKRAAVSTDQ